MIVPHEQYLGIARTESARREVYRALLKAHLAPETLDEIRQSTNGNFALGGERFKKQIEKALGQRVRRGKPGRPRQAEANDAAQMDLL